ncbi:hypothetical protein [Exiguobacterium sp. KRL4]|uniref:hypothetical protein n=1 Tax=Exiguobacterium sp. KRL4 TaxID=1914536 RepID=UPI001373088E|nr:hypothetical protein [Exiguobacterium sp. KRL4]
MRYFVHDGAKLAVEVRGHGARRNPVPLIIGVRIFTEVLVIEVHAINFSAVDAGEAIILVNPRELFGIVRFSDVQDRFPQDFDVFRTLGAF